MMVVDVVVRHVGGSVWSAEPIGLSDYKPGALLAVSRDLQALLRVHTPTLVSWAIGADRASFSVRFLDAAGGPCLSVG